MSVRILGPPAGARGARIDRGLLRRRAIRLLRELGQARSELSLVLADDVKIAEMNRGWRGVRGPTDVLSFSLLDGEAAAQRGRLLGDVVIGIETAARQAAERRRGLDETVARLLIHGLLHLLGYDHAHPDEARAMRCQERLLWRSLRG